MQKIWSLEVFGVIVPKKSPKHFSFKKWKFINVHSCIDTCHKFTLSPNNLIFKLIVFVEKTTHLYSMAEIKTLKKEKLVFNYQTLKVC